MWDTLSPPYQACMEETWRAYCSDTQPIGAVITGPDGEILARGRNRIRDKQRVEPYTHGHPLAHAELNALLSFDYRAVDPHSCILYTSLEPCPLCMGAFYMSGLRRLHFAARDPMAGSTNLLGATWYLSRKAIEVCGPEREDLESIIAAINTDFDLHHGRPLSPNLLFERWEAAMPGGLRLGKRLYDNGELLRLRDQSAGAAEVVDRLAELLVEVAASRRT